MTRIRHLEITNFRSIRHLSWFPSPGINCLVGAGDSGKSTILDAIDLCLGARRNLSFFDTDFYQLDVTNPVSIFVTIGALPDQLKNIDLYGDFLRGFDFNSGRIEDEPRVNIETVLTIRLQVFSDLEPVWSLFSLRGEQQGLERSLGWKDRSIIAPSRVGNFANAHLSWTRGSVLNRLTDERANLGAELARAAREARASFGNQAGVQLGQTLDVVNQTALDLGVPTGGATQALLDAHSVSIGDGAIALHNATGIPLRSLGTGSSRLLITGLQRQVAEAATITLVDEVEYGLEPHRLIRLLDSLGAKDLNLPLQVFLTTHSPVAVRELSSNQLFVVRPQQQNHNVLNAGTSDDVQSTLRADPEAFLAKFVIVCEGASEVGLVRGLDQFWNTRGYVSVTALGGAYVNVGGSNPDRCFTRGLAMLNLGYQVLVVVDADKPPTYNILMAFRAAGGEVLTWGTGRALEDELFCSLGDPAISALLAKACEVVGRELVDQHIMSKSNGQRNLNSVEAEPFIEGRYTQETKALLGNASRIRGSGWYKSVTTYQEIGKEIVGPHFGTADVNFQNAINLLWGWTRAAGN